MTSVFSIQRAARILLAGGVIAYPTESIYGLGCIPDHWDAVAHLLDIKGRRTQAGLILISPNFTLLEEWLAPTAQEMRRIESTTALPVTWVVTAHPATPDWLTGGRRTLAIRISKHPVVGALCDATGSALVSTSANRSGRPPARSTLTARKSLGSQVDYVVPGALGNAPGPSEIRMAQDNRVLRPATRTVSD